LDVAAQRLAVEQLRDKCGAAVAIEPATGRVPLLASAPTYNPNAIERTSRAFTNAKSQLCVCRAAPQPRDAGLYPPGSTFKTVHRLSGADSGKFRPDSSF